MREGPQSQGEDGEAEPGRRQPCGQEHRHASEATMMPPPTPVMMIPPAAPRCAGKNVHRRFGRWLKSGVFERIFRHLAAHPDDEYVMPDSTIVRAHQHSAGARTKGARTRPSAAPAAD